MSADELASWHGPQLAVQLSVTATPHPQDLQSCGPPVAWGSRCSADARTGTEAPPPRAWLGLLFWKVILAGGHS